MIDAFDNYSMKIKKQLEENYFMHIYVIFVIGSNPVLGIYMPEQYKSHWFLLMVAFAVFTV